MSLGLDQQQELQPLRMVSQKLDFVKQFCKINPHTPTAIILSELQIRPILHACWLRIIRFYNELCRAPDSDVHKRMLVDNLRDAISRNVRNWSHDLITYFRRMGFDFPIRCDMAESVDLEAFLLGAIPPLTWMPRGLLRPHMPSNSESGTRG